MDRKKACVITYFGDGGTSEVNILLLYNPKETSLPLNFFYRGV